MTSIGLTFMAPNRGAKAIDTKEQCRLATEVNIANILFDAPGTVDGVIVQDNDRILIKAQTAGEENGIYTILTASGGEWERASDFDTSEEVKSGVHVFVTEGTINKDTGWQLITDDPIILGTTVLVWARFSDGIVPVGVEGSVQRKLGSALGGDAFHTFDPATKVEQVLGSVDQRGGTSALKYSPVVGTGVPISGVTLRYGVEAGGFLYAVSVDIDDGELEIFDTNVSPMVSVGSLPMPGARAVAISGHVVYISITGGAIFKLVAVDVMDRSNPVELGRTANLGNDLLGVVVNGGVAYVGVEPSKVFSIDVRDPENMVKIDEFVADGNVRVEMDLVTDFLYFATFPAGSLYVVDVSDPGNMVEKSKRTSASDVRFSVKVHAGKMYVLSDTTKSLEIYDVNDPSDTGAAVGSVVLDAGTIEPRAMVIAFPFVYIVSKITASLLVVDVTDATNPVLVSNPVTTGADPVAIVLRGEDGFVFDKTAGDIFPVKITGIIAQTANIGSLAASNASINKNLIVGNHVTIEGGLNVEGAILSNTSFSATGEIQSDTLEVKSNADIETIIAGKGNHPVVALSDIEIVQPVSGSQGLTFVGFSVAAAVPELLTDGVALFGGQIDNDNMQLWVGQRSHVNDVNENFFRLITRGANEIPIISAVNGNGTVNVPICIGSADSLVAMGAGFVDEGDVVAQVHLKGGATGRVTHIDQAFAAQTANIYEVRDSADNVLASIDKDGNFTGPNMGSLNIIAIRTAAEWDAVSLDGNLIRIMVPDLDLTASPPKAFPEQPNQCRIEGFGREVCKITYNGSGDLFTSSPHDDAGTLQIFNIDIIADGTAGGRCFGDITGSIVAFFFLHQVDIVGFSDLGKVNGYKIFGSTFSVFTGNAIGLESTCARNFFSVATMDDQDTGPLLTISGIDARLLSLHNTSMEPDAALFAIKLDNGLDASFRANVNNVFDCPADQLFDTTGLDQTDVRVSSNDNQLQQNSMFIAEARTPTQILVPGGISTRLPIEKAVPVAGDWVSDAATERFTVNTSTGLITYLGATRVFLISFKVTASHVGGGSQTVDFDIGINGTQQVKSITTLTAGTDIDGIFVGGVFTLNINDTVQVFKTSDSANDVNVEVHPILIFG